MKTIQSIDITNKVLDTSLKKGQAVWLDKDCANRSKVIVISQTPKEMFTTVRNGSDEWSVMTYRLTPSSRS